MDVNQDNYNIYIITFYNGQDSGKMCSSLVYIQCQVSLVGHIFFTGLIKVSFVCRRLA